MNRLSRPLVVGVGVTLPALMILTEHPWIGAATFTAVFATLLLRPRARVASPPTADTTRVRELVPSGSVPAAPIGAEDLPRPQRDGLIHYPPRRLPL